MKGPNVSIVIPTFNRKHYLVDAIDSCIAQTVQCEIIICDHGSTDGTEDFILDAYSDRITYIRKDIDYGPHFCWLDGIIQSKGEYVHLQFDDDWIKPTYIEECLKLFNNDVGFVFSAAEVFNQETNTIENILNSNLGETGVYSNRKFERRLLTTLISPGAILIRKKDAISAIYQGSLPLQIESYHGVGPDYLYSLLPLLSYKKIGYIKDTLAVFRSHKDSITIDASNDVSRQLSLVLSYNEARKFYFNMKFCKLFKIHLFMQLFYPVAFLKRTLSKLLNSFKNYENRKM